MKIAAIAKVIKDRGSCRLYRVHGSDDLETKFYIGTNSEIYSLEGFPKPKTAGPRPTTPYPHITQDQNARSNSNKQIKRRTL